MLMLYGIKDCANLTLFDLATDEPELYTNYANVSTNEWTSERTFATAKGTRAIAWDSDRQGTLAVEMEVFDLKWLAITAGSEIEKGEKDIGKRQVGVIGQEKSITLDQTPIAGSVQVVEVDPKDEVEHIGLTLQENVSSEDPLETNQFRLEGDIVKFGDDVIEGAVYAVYYLTQVTGVRTISISADKFPKAFKVVGDVLIREKETGKDEFAQIVYVNARPQSNFTITMSESEPTNLSVTFDLFPNKDKAIAEYNILGE